MKLSDFDYKLPPERIAQTPTEPRDASRLLVLNRTNGALEHRIFNQIGDYLWAGDVLVLNKTRVIPARIPARKETGGAAEILLLKKLADRRWLVMVGGQGLKAGVKLNIGENGLRATIEEEKAEAQRIISFSDPIENHWEALGQTPLPPYITTPLDDAERYQTVYAQTSGSAAAPTAGLHFTPDLLLALTRAGIQIAYCTLHVGLDTFAPVKVEDISKHQIHRERAILSAEDAKRINEAKLGGGRIIAVGTTSARTLESAAIRSAAFGTPANDPASIMGTLRALSPDACPWRPVMALDEETDLFITPGFTFRALDALITNFHLPKSTLLMMISAFAGRERILAAYQAAIEAEYRFYSFGDAMLIS